MGYHRYMVYSSDYLFLDYFLIELLIDFPKMMLCVSGTHQSQSR
jgi:hypothetical protein